jgi:hypothetical protein
MALSYVTYTGDNSTTNFTFDKGYIQQSDVAVYLDGVLQTLTTHYTWFNDTTIQFLSPPALDVVVLIERSTENTSRLVDFQDAANLTEADLDLNSDQMFYLAQESQDDFTDNAMTRDTDNKWDANSLVIKNVADPTNDQDAATLAYGEANWGGTAAAAAAASAAAAATSESNAADSEANAAASESNAATSETNAAASYDAFDDRYLGSKTSDPALDNDGDALVTGAIYYNSVSEAMRVYNGSSWQNFSTFSVLDYIYTASASQTSFTGADDEANTLAFDSSSNVMGVFQNGVRLIEGAGNDYTIGTNTVTLTSGAALDDLIVIQVATNFDVSGAISQTTADTRYLKKTDDLSDMYTPTKGNILVANGTAFAEVPVGTDGYVLEADSADAEGIVWHVPRVSATRFTSTSDYAITGATAATATAVTSTTAITIPTKGVIRVSLAQARFQAHSSSAMTPGLALEINGVTYGPSFNDNGTTRYTYLATMTANEYLEVYAQSSTAGIAPLNLGGGVIELDIEAIGCATGSQSVAIAIYDEGYVSNSGNVKGNLLTTIGYVEIFDYT